MSAVLPRLENGILATFTVAMARLRNERTISIRGTEVRICGEFEQGVITRIRHAGFGPDGGDTLLAGDFAALMDGNPSAVRASLRDAIAATACLAADRSVAEERTVVLGEYRPAIYND